MKQVFIRLYGAILGEGMVTCFKTRGAVSLPLPLKAVLFCELPGA